MNFKFFPNTQEAVKYAGKCDDKRITEFKEQHQVIKSIRDSLEVIELFYKAGFERDKATAIANTQHVLSQINGFVAELIEEYEGGE